jgi:hypothetical protein
MLFFLGAYRQRDHGRLLRRRPVNDVSRLESFVSWALKSGLALLLTGAIWWFWPRLSLPMLGREEVWFSLAWLLLLAGPAAMETWWLRLLASDNGDDEPTLPESSYERGAFLLGLIFLAMLLAGSGLGNYKLWLGIVYLVALNLRLAGLTLGLRGCFGGGVEGDLLPLLSASFISFLACLLIIPWVRPELCAVWPPPLKPLGISLTAALLWGAIAGAAPLAVWVWGAGRRAARLTYLAMGLGPGPVLAVEVLTLCQLSLVFLGLSTLILARLLIRHRQPPPMSNEQPEPLCWLLRALLLLWWGVGVALTLAAAWWQPRVQSLVTESLWLRAVGLGTFLVACLGLLAEYSLPLLGRPNLVRHTGQCKTRGLIMTTMAILASLTPLIMMRTESSPPPLPFLAERARAELLPAPMSLSPANPEVTMSAPSWLTRVSRVFVVSLLTNAAELEQGEAVVQLVITDDQDIPHIYNLRAGVDTAEWTLSKRDVAAIARHASTRPAHGWVVYAPTGEAFEAHDYFTGLFLGSEVNLVKQVSLRYLYRNPPGRVPVTLDLKRVFLN